MSDPREPDPQATPQMPPPEPPAAPQPLPMPPPPMMAPPVPKGQAFKKGFGTGLGASLGFMGTLAIFGIITSLISMMALMGLASAFKGEAQTSVESLKTVWGDDGAKKTLRAIKVTGTIQGDSSEGMSLGAGTYGYEVAQKLDKLKASDADGVVLLMNTPGGTVHGSKAIADAAARYRERTGKKVFAYVQGTSASGGMYAMAGADKIVADHGSMVGSIGIIFGPFSRYKNVTAITGNILQSGVVAGSITQEYLSQGTSKDFGDPFRDMTDAERKHYLASLANEYDAFVGWVSSNRKIPAETIKNNFGALMFDGKTATEKKLIDGVAGRDEAFRDFAQIAGLDPAQTKVVAATAPSVFAQMMGAEARVWGESLPAPAVNGQAPRATSALCSGNSTILAFQGSITGVCG